MSPPPAPPFTSLRDWAFLTGLPAHPELVHAILSNAANISTTYYSNDDLWHVASACMLSEALATYTYYRTFSRAIEAKAIEALNSYHKILAHVTRFHSAPGLVTALHFFGTSHTILVDAGY